MIQAAAAKAPERQGKFISLVRGLSFAIAASLVVAVAARIAFPLPFTPVPFTLQPLAVLLVGLTFGPSLGAAAMVLYLLEGACGLPVFSPTGPGGVLQLFGPTGGFLFAYPAVAGIAGWVTRRLQVRGGDFLPALAGSTAATLILFLLGADWLMLQLHLGWHATMTAAVLPFLPGEAVKIFAAAGLYRALRRSSYRLNAQHER